MCGRRAGAMLAQDCSVADLLRGTPLERHLPALLSRPKPVSCASDLLVQANELGASLARVPPADVDAMVLRAARRFLPPLETPLGLPLVRLPFACPVLDPLFGGGLQLSGIVELVGAAGAAKTQLALWLAGRSLAEHPASGVVYVCTEGAFPARRFAQMHGEAALARVVVERAASLEALWSVLSARLLVLVNATRARLVVIDSLGALRAEDEEAGGGGDRNDHLWRLAQHLKWINEQTQCGVLVLNQVRADMSAGAPEGAVQPALGLVWSTCVNTRVFLRRTPRGERVLRVDLCPYLPRFEAPFHVTAAGVSGRAADDDAK